MVPNIFFTLFALLPLFVLAREKGSIVVYTDLRPNPKSKPTFDSAGGLKQETLFFEVDFDLPSQYAFRAKNMPDQTQGMGEFYVNIGGDYGQSRCYFQKKTGSSFQGDMKFYFRTQASFMAPCGTEEDPVKLVCGTANPSCDMREWGAPE